MKKLLYIFLGIVIGASSISYGASIMFPYQGGTGKGSATAGDVGKCLTISDDSPFTYAFASCGSGSGGAFSWTVNSWGNSTSTTLGFLNGFLSTASSTISSSLRLPSLTQGFLYTGSTGLVQPIASSSIKLSWFDNDSGFITSSASTTLFSDFNTWTGRNNFTYASTTQLDVTGTATSTFAGSINMTGIGSHLTTHGIRSDASDGIHFHANNWTDVANFGLGNTANATFYGGVNVTGSFSVLGTSLATWPYSSSTVYSSFVNSSTTDAYFGTGQGIAYIGSGGRLRTTATSTFSLSQFTNDLASLTAGDSSLTFSGSYNGSVARTVGLNTGRTNTWSVLQNFNYSSTTGQATFANASSTLWNGGGLQTCDPTTGKLTWSAGQFGCGTDQTGGGGFSGAANSIIVSDSSGTSLIATGTQLTVGNLIATTTASSYFLGKLGIGSTSPSYALAVSPTTGVTAGRTMSVYDATPSTGITTLTIRRGADAGVSNLLQFVDNSENLQTAFNQGGTLNFGGGLQRPFIGSDGLGLGDGDYIHLANSSPFIWSSTNDGQGTADLGIYRNAAGVLEVNNGTPGSLAKIVYAYSSSTAYSSFITASSTFSINSSVDILDFLKFPVSSSPTMTVAGRIALDSTSNNLVLATSTNGHIVVASATTTLYSFVASTTAITSGTIIDMPSHPLQQVVSSLWCKVSSGTSIQIFISDGTNDTNTITCTTTGTQYAITTNNIFTSYEGIRMEYGTKTGDTGYLSVRVMGYRIAD